MDDGGAVVWSSATNIDFLVNFLSILISNIIWTLTFSYSVLTFPFLILSGVTSSIYLNWIHTFAISFEIALVQKSFPDFSIS